MRGEVPNRLSEQGLVQLPGRCPHMVRARSRQWGVARPPSAAPAQAGSEHAALDANGVAAVILRVMREPGDLERLWRLRNLESGAFRTAASSWVELVRPASRRSNGRLHEGWAAGARGATGAKRSWAIAVFSPAYESYGRGKNRDRALCDFYINAKPANLCIPITEIS